MIYLIKNKTLRRLSNIKCIFEIASQEKYNFLIQGWNNNLLKEELLDFYTEIKS